MVIDIIINLYKPITCTPTVKPEVNYEIYVTMCQCRHINYNKCTPLMRNVDNRYIMYPPTVHVWGQRVRKISVSSA